jgi:hypothetical protein
MYCQFIQDLCTANEVVILYTHGFKLFIVLTEVPWDIQYFTILYAENAFFCLALFPDSQYWLIFIYGILTHRRLQSIWGF